MTIDNFIQANQLLPADALVVKKEPFHLLDHYIIYLGQDDYNHVFIANYKAGTRLLSEEELLEFMPEFLPSRIVRFKGNPIQRDAAVQRALSRKDQSSYHLILNNCEHFSNYVQTGTGYSQQSKTLGGGLLLTGLLAAATTKNNGVQIAGLIAATLGIVTLMMDQE